MDYEQVNISPLSARETHVVDAASHSAVQSPSTMTHAPIMVDSVIPTVMKMNNEYWLIGIIIVLIMVVIMLIVYIVKIKNASENEPKRT